MQVVFILKSNEYSTFWNHICKYIFKLCCPYSTRKPTLSIFHQVINVVVMRKTFQDFVSFWYKLCLFERQLNYLHIDTNHYSRTPLTRPPSESHWCGRIRGMVAREGFVYEQKPLSVTRNVVVWEGWSLVRVVVRQGFYCMLYPKNMLQNCIF